MGNAWFGKRRSRKGSDQLQLQPVERHAEGVMRFKVRMRSGELEELMAKVDMSRGDSSELGTLIFQECLKGRLRARVVAVTAGKGSSELSEFKYPKGWGLRLSPIQEYSDQ